MKNIRAFDLINTLVRKKYKIFTDGAYNLNIIGVRSHNSVSDKFDDLICVLYKDNSGTWRLKKFKATTDPGKYWLTNPLNKNGTIIMVPGQYRGVYKIGLHGVSGKYPYKALRQVKPISYVRDNNKNLELDFELYKDESNIFRDICYTNIHRASRWKNMLTIGKYSAGCQVIHSHSDFQEFMSLCKKQVKAGQGTSFTYTLLEEKDICI